ncbi:hypothetical protein [Peterkaempfera bronchialis]|uniref:Uncharacterized protein n=1 Tax=Peterkaempfera bronchialis TaxID=2126346 RepID=A0A345SQX7_9ACTN|nr:hypothetical protein [Peterkaempfera bronchialis]AXI76132.1 hypothetical protein C7M71_000175 [Peterkaempfera bronchialis]
MAEGAQDVVELGFGAVGERCLFECGQTGGEGGDERVFGGVRVVGDGEVGGGVGESRGEVSVDYEATGEAAEFGGFDAVVATVGVGVRVRYAVSVRKSVASWRGSRGWPSLTALAETPALPG